MDQFTEKIIIDSPGSDGWSHLVGSDLEMLHAFARLIGLQRHWFQNKRGKDQPHYDVRGDKIQQAILNGAKVVNTRYVIQYLAHHYSQKPEIQMDLFQMQAIPTFSHHST